MSRVATLLRLIVLSAAAFAVSIVPVARAFAEAPTVPAAASFVPARRAASSSRCAHRMPRLRRPKRPSLSMMTESGPATPFVPSARRRVPARERSVRAASFAPLLDHPPA
jgi:hypothetical protein